MRYQGAKPWIPDNTFYLSCYHNGLDTACSVVTYTDQNGVKFIRRTWISAVDDVLFMHVTASEKGMINFRGYLDRGIWVDSVYAENGMIFLEDSHGIPFCVGAAVSASGGVFSTVIVCPGKSPYK